MDIKKFEQIKRNLNSELDKLDEGSPVGIMMGIDLYVEFRKQDLLEQKLVDMVLWQWKQPSYRNRYVVDSWDILAEAYEVGEALSNK